MSQHRARSQLRSLLATGALVVTVAVLVVGLALTRPGGADIRGSAQLSKTLNSNPETRSTSDRRSPAERSSPGRQRSLPFVIQRGSVIRPEPPGPALAPISTGRVGTGLVLGPIGAVNAPTGVPVRGLVTASVANLPNRTSAGGFASSLHTLTAEGQDFVMLNEVSRRSIEGIRSVAPGYDAYRDPAPDRSTGGVQSMNNVVMWRTERWNLVDAGRIKVIDNDTGIHSGKRFTWDRYATWATLQRKTDGAIVSVVSTHMPTNPMKFPRQLGNPGMSRVERYSRGMDVLVSTVRALGEHGPVLVAGDMNSHPGQGAWTAAAKMTAAGFRYVKDRGVMYLFFQSGVDVAANRQVGVASDHPAIVTTLDMNGLDPR